MAACMLLVSATVEGLQHALLSSEKSAFMPAAAGAMAFLGASLIRLPGPPAGMGGGGAGGPLLGGTTLEPAACGASAPALTQTPSLSQGANWS